MTISYNWLNEYLPTGQAGLPGTGPGVNEKMDPERIAKILTSIGLEVEGIHEYEEIKGGLKGLLVGEINSCEKHPDADKLKITTVSIGTDEALEIVCGASNVAVGQKVVVAPVGSIIYPLDGDAVNIKKAKIRGRESFGMICAEDEIGISNNHDGILVLPPETIVGTAVSEIYKPYNDFIFEIGLTPNRMDAMSHIGVAKDVCAFLSHHNHKESLAILPYKNMFKPDSQGMKIDVVIENEEACQRYSCIGLEGITVTHSPVWLQQKLKSIGLKPINNIVDITNFILHETGQPLHAFDADKIKGNLTNANAGKIFIKTLPENTIFKTLDGKERKLTSTDLMICNNDGPLCIAGVYGGLESGVTNETKNIFIESAWFHPEFIRKTSLRHGLRTDAATRFEKGTDVINTVNVLKRVALLIKEIAGGEIASDVIDVYPNPAPKVEIGLKFHYLKKLSGKNYHGDTIKNILKSLDFEIVKEGIDEIRVKVPYSKPDIKLPADVVEEIMRIDGLDNIEIPSTITISPAIDLHAPEFILKEKIANYLTGLGFYEIFTNSITNSAFYNEVLLKDAVKIMNNVSAGLDIMRPSMLESGLQSLSYNINRKNTSIKFFEFGKTYSMSASHTLEAGRGETNHLTLFVTGNIQENNWQSQGIKAGFYYVKAVCEKIVIAGGLKNISYESFQGNEFETGAVLKINDINVGKFGKVNDSHLKQFDIKQEVFYADINWDEIKLLKDSNVITYKEICKFPLVQRDLALVVNKETTYSEIQKATKSAKVDHLKSINLFDVFESEKLGEGKKSMAVNYTFMDETKTLTDIETDAMMQKIIAVYEKELNAEIRK